MPVTGAIIRPPAEAGSLLLQVTTGCSANSCDFCGAYMGKNFSFKNEEEIFCDIESAKRSLPDTRKVFLLDGDALATPNERLIPVLKKIRERFPRLSRVSSYANGYNITSRSQEELIDLYDNKVSLIYMGLESGSQKVLDRCQKKATVEEMVSAVKMASNAGIKSSVIVLIGLGGKEASGDHVSGTIDALNRMQPQLLSFLSLMLIPGTGMYGAAMRSEFMELDTKGMLKETRDMVKGLELKHTVFRSDHASNYLSLKGRFPKDKVRFLGMLDRAIEGKAPLRGERDRGL